MNAFDFVVHSKLLFKRINIRLSKLLPNWISAYLTNRPLQVQVEHALYDPIGIISRIPQGSVLGAYPVDSIY